MGIARRETALAQLFWLSDKAWALVSTNPAEAAGLDDRGRIAPGLRGEVVVVDPAVRAPVATFAAGRLAWVSPAGAARLN